MKIAAYLRPNESRTNERIHHFGMALGAELTYRDNPIADCDLAISAGFQIHPGMRDAMVRGIPIIVLETPVWHYGDKHASYTWAYNGLHGLGYTPEACPTLIRPHPELGVWRDWNSGRVTIFGQVENDKALRGSDHSKWIKSVQDVLPQAELREHPIMINMHSPEWEDMEPFEECLAATSLAVTYTSTTGSEAVIAGIPTIAVHPGSLAYDVASHTLSEAPVTPDRDEWIRKLSLRHWTVGETVDVDYILSGYEEARQVAEQGEYDNMSNGRQQP